MYPSIQNLIHAKDLTLSSVSEPFPATTPKLREHPLAEATTSWATTAAFLRCVGRQPSPKLKLRSDHPLEKIDHPLRKKTLAKERQDSARMFIRAGRSLSGGHTLVVWRKVCTRSVKLSEFSRGDLQSPSLAIVPTKCELDERMWTQWF